MLYRYSEIFRTTLMISDLSLVAASWALAYWIRFFTGWSAPRGIPEFEPYAYALIGILPLAFFTFRTADVGTVDVAPVETTSTMASSCADSASVLRSRCSGPQ